MKSVPKGVLPRTEIWNRFQKPCGMLSHMHELVYAFCSLKVCLSCELAVRRLSRHFTGGAHQAQKMCVMCDPRSPQLIAHTTCSRQRIAVNSVNSIKTENHVSIRWSHPQHINTLENKTMTSCVGVSRIYLDLFVALTTSCDTGDCWLQVLFLFQGLW